MSLGMESRFSWIASRRSGSVVTGKPETGLPTIPRSGNDTELANGGLFDDNTHKCTIEERKTQVDVEIGYRAAC